jgi:Ni/Co efflux regulator RcnB
MNKKQWTAVATALMMGSASLSAFAQPGPRGPQQGHGPALHPMQQSHPAHPQVGLKHQAPAYRPSAQPQRPGHPHGMPPGQAKRMGAGPQHNWVKGSRVPRQYRSQHYVVNNLRHHGLKQPPRGYQWVQYGSDYMLVAIATGVIAQLVLSH